MVGERRDVKLVYSVFVISLPNTGADRYCQVINRDQGKVNVGCWNLLIVVYGTTKETNDYKIGFHLSFDTSKLYSF